MTSPGLGPCAYFVMGRGASLLDFGNFRGVDWIEGAIASSPRGNL
jgi:hypothetical protein